MQRRRLHVCTLGCIQVRRVITVLSEVVGEIILKCVFGKRYEIVDWNLLVQHLIQWHAFMNMVMNLMMLKTGWEFNENMSEFQLVKRNSSPMNPLVSWLLESKTGFPVFGNSSLVKKEC
jgi:hypothetical protein